MNGRSCMHVCLVMISSYLQNSLTRYAPLANDSQARTGARFHTSCDKRYIIKTITSEDVAEMHNILKKYHQFIVECHGNTLLPQFLGMYRLNVDGVETYMIVTRNVFSHRLSVYRKYDLKGSTVAREASDKEKAKELPTYKDNDFINDGQKICIDEDNKKMFREKLKKDVEFLSQLKLMDYSLLVGIHDVERAEQEDVESEDNDGEEEGESDGTHPVGTPPDSPGNTLNSTKPLLPGEFDPTIDVYGIKSHEPSTGGEQRSRAQRWRTDSGSYPMFTLVTGDLGIVGRWRAVCVTALQRPNSDAAAIRIVVDAPRKEVYFMAIIDILTHYDAKKKAAHAAKTVKHGLTQPLSCVLVCTTLSMEKRKKTKELSEDLRNQIVRKHEQSQGYKSISKDLNVPVSTVRSVIKKFKAHGTVANFPRCGRKRKIDKRFQRKIVQMLDKEPRLTSKQVQAALQSEGTTVSTRTVRRRLTEKGLYAVHVAASVPRDALREAPEMMSRSRDRDIISGPSHNASLGTEAATCTAESRENSGGLRKAGAEISTVNPEQYSKRFLDFINNILT
ncbi:unnamed protein product [Ranitomeya imitator]|uniref:Phosphatidylinositol 5-phosphate 4-kinase type-2 alpha n=2 Tax=Anura TaxID=8342 RepID=A0ABN9KT59_9NEOB|nr:unnamed protein product [Ranitomeya imitator]